MNLIIPALFGMIWFIIFGGAGYTPRAFIWRFMVIHTKLRMEVSLFRFLNKISFCKNTIYIFYIGYIYFNSYNVRFCYNNYKKTINKNQIRMKKLRLPTKINIFWGVLMASMAIVNLICAGGKISGIDATKQIATVAGFPILFFMIA
ncbi:BCCT family transporter [Paraclostridium bifermentans]|nr:BCCT family transporter [Paraclostridium bifermentans]